MGVVLSDYYSESEVVNLGGYSNVNSLRTAISKGTLPLEFATIGNQKYCRKEDLHRLIEARLAKKQKRAKPSPSKFQDAKKSMRSLKSECAEETKSAS